MNENIICPNCNATCKPGSLYCHNCGYMLPAGIDERQNDRRQDCRYEDSDPQIAQQPYQQQPYQQQSYQQQPPYQQPQYGYQQPGPNGWNQPMGNPQYQGMPYGGRPMHVGVDPNINPPRNVDQIVDPESEIGMTYESIDNMIESATRNMKGMGWSFTIFTIVLLRFLKHYYKIFSDSFYYIPESKMGWVMLFGAVIVMAYISMTIFGLMQMFAFKKYLIRFSLIDKEKFSVTALPWMILGLMAIDLISIFVESESLEMFFEIISWIGSIAVAVCGFFFIGRISKSIGACLIIYGVSSLIALSLDEDSWVMIIVLWFVNLVSLIVAVEAMTRYLGGKGAMKKKR